MKKFKSTLLLTMIVALFLVAFCMSASAAEWVNIDETTMYNFDEETGVMVIKGTDSTLRGSSFGVVCGNHYKVYCDCDFFNEFDDYPTFSAKVYEAKAVAGKTKTLIVSEGITKLGAGVFANFKDVETVILHTSVTEISDGAFYALKKLRTVVLTNSVTTIGEGAFSGCTGLQYLYIPDSVKTIENAAFYDCDPNSVRLPENLEKKGKSLFVPDVNSLSALLSVVTASTGAGDYRSCASAAGVEFYTYNKSTGKHTVFSKVSAKNYPTVSTEYLANLMVGKTYYFSCRYLSIVNGKKIYSDYAYADKYVQAPKQRPMATYEKTSDTSIKISWKKVEGATGYAVFQRVSSKWKTLGKTTKLYGNINNLDLTTKDYKFAVRPYVLVDGQYILGNAYDEILVIAKPGTVTAKVTSPAKGQIKLTWEKATDATGYDVYYKLNNGNYKLYKSYASPQNLTFSNLKSGARYKFAVRSYKKVTGSVYTYYGDYKPVSVTVK